MAKSLKLNIEVQVKDVNFTSGGIDEDAILHFTYNYSYPDYEDHEVDLGATTSIDNILVNEESIKNWFVDEIYDELLQFVYKELDYSTILSLNDGDKITLPKPSIGKIFTFCYQPAFSDEVKEKIADSIEWSMVSSDGVSFQYTWENVFDRFWRDGYDFEIYDDQKIIKALQDTKVHYIEI